MVGIIVAFSIGLVCLVGSCALTSLPHMSTDDRFIHFFVTLLAVVFFTLGSLLLGLVKGRDIALNSLPNMVSLDIIEVNTNKLDNLSLNAYNNMDVRSREMVEDLKEIF